MKKVALIVAGGSGRRMNSSTPKQFLLLKNKPILIHTIRQFRSFDKIIVVLPATKINFWKKLCKETEFPLKHVLIKGGANRFESVKNGLANITEQSIVAIHDGVRPLISKNLIDRLIQEVKEGVGAVPIIPITSSVLEINKTDLKHVDRSNLYKLQTPQCFIFSDIRNAYQQEYSDFFTDDSSVFNNTGYKIIPVLGERKNIKITTKEDLKIAESFIQ
ncbi:MAG: 2-C-methyl-D-erythritol 4-phosphate cytidylyltransferase [Flavobacteriales bacterium]|nr:2-C-methyl-D-erythritol 4-phosphate cytidylyltransferase [Flavobacteriales bacterium]